MLITHSHFNKYLRNLHDVNRLFIFTYDVTGHDFTISMRPKHAANQRERYSTGVRYAANHSP